MIPRTLFAPEHETFRASVRRFLEAEVKPHDERWQEQGYVDKAVWKKAGEHGAGSDLQAIKTTALRKGDGYVLNGSKTFITNGWNCDLVIVVAKTDPAKGAKGTSLLVIDTSMKGFVKGKRLKKMGLKGQDTAELFFDNVEVPAENLLGQENNGFIYLMQELPWERMQIAIAAVAKCEAALGWTIAYVNDRKAFGKPVASFQNTRFKLAEIATEVQVMRVFV